MKGKQLAILLVLAIALGGAWYFLSERNRASWSETGGGGGKVVEFPINDVARLVIKNSTGELNLVKKADVWTVQERADYPASFEQVSDLLRKLWELKTVQEVKAGASQLPRLELVEPGKGEKAGTLVEFKDKDGKTLNALLLGKKHMRASEGGPMDFGGSAAGRYVKTLSGAKVSLVSEAFDNAEPKPERWISKDFVKIENPKSIAVAGPSETQHWTVTRDSTSAEWKLADVKPDEKFDATKASPLGSVFSSPSFNDILAPDAKPADTGLDKPATATIETFDGFHYELKIGKANGEAYPVVFAVSANFSKERTPGKEEKPEDKKRLDDDFAGKQKQFEEKLAKEKKFEGRAYLVAKFAVEPLLKDRAALMANKPAETAAAPPATGTAEPPVIPPRVNVKIVPPAGTLAPAPSRPEAVTPLVPVPSVPTPAKPQPAPPTVPEPTPPSSPSPAGNNQPPAKPEAEK